MNDILQNEGKKLSNSYAMRIALLYLLIGGIWIVFSDNVINYFVQDPAMLTEVQTAKGWFFISVTSLLLLFLIRKHIRVIHKTTVMKNALAKHFDNFTKYANDIILLIDENGTIVEANEKAIETYKYDKGALIGNNISILTADIKGYAQESFLSVIERRDALFDYYQKTKDGRVIPTEVSSRKLEIDHNIFYQTIIRDISERVEAQNKLSDSEKKYRELTDLLPQTVFEVDTKGNLLFVNDAAFEIFRYSREDFNRGLNVFNMLAEEDIDKAKELFKIKQNGQKTGTVQYTALKKDGTRFPVMIYSNPIMREGKIAGFRGILVDISEQIKSQQALKESEEKFRNLVEASPDAIVVHKNGIIEFVNNAAVKLMGAENEKDLLGKNAIDFVHPDSLPMVTDRIKRVTSDNEPQTLAEEKFIRLDGETIFVEVAGIPFNFENKKATQVVIRDITWRIEAESALRESENKYRKVIESANDAIILADAKTGTILDINKKAEILLGRKKSEVIGQNQTIIHPPIEKDYYDELFRTASYLNRKISLSELYIRHSNGKNIPVEISNSAFMLEGKEVVLGIFRDISERKKSQEQIRKLSRAVEQNPNSIVITDVKGSIEYINPKFSELTGYLPDEVIGKNPRILKSGETPPEVYKKLWRDITEGKEWYGEFHNKKKSGELYWESVSISPIRNDLGNITHFIAIKEDITGKKKIENELISAKEKAEESDRLKSEFLAQMSHEIRTPLNVILSYNSLLKEELEGKIDDELSMSFNSIDNASKRLLRTIDLILNMAAVQTGNLKLELAEVDLGKILDTMMLEFKQAAQNKNLELNLKNEANDTRIIAEEYIVSEIFQNLIDNAIKYTHEGKVDVEIKKTADKKISVSVSDTGIGIKEEYLPSIFHAFSQEETGYSRKFEGNGLGLALVKNYVDLLNAEINVISEKNRGSSFSVTFTSS